MSVFPRLSVLNQLQSLGQHEQQLNRTCLVGIQHLLETTGSLLEALAVSGLPAHHIHLLGKTYSSNQQVARQLRRLGMHVYDSGEQFPWGGYDAQLYVEAIDMWRSVAGFLEGSEIDRIIVLDDGGCATATIPDDLQRRYPIIAVEQTMSGLHAIEADELSIPVIAVASSAVKRLIEPPMICEAAFRRAYRCASEFEHQSMGIIGAGSIGRAILRGAVAGGHTVNIYDPGGVAAGLETNVRACASIEELLAASDVLWGCSGTDALSGVKMNALSSSTKTLISCSSSDREFRALLRPLNRRREFDAVDRLSDVHFVCDEVALNVRRGGFPINFDGSAESVPAAHIQVTRGLLFAGVIQACSQPNEPAAWMLSPEAQKAIMNAWFEERPDRTPRSAPGLVEAFADEEWIAEQSGGCRLATTR